MEKIFAAAINCMDGRVQEPVTIYMKENFNVNYVDMITEPGPNKILAEETDTALVESIKKRLEISVLKHGSKVVAITGHYDCAGNPATEEEQKAHLAGAVKVVEAWGLPLEEIVGLWLDEEFKVIKNTGNNL
jgi:carbonic anhydrase